MKSDGLPNDSARISMFTTVENVRVDLNVYWAGEGLWIVLWVQMKVLFSRPMLMK